MCFGRHAVFACRCDQANTQRLGQHQHIARARTRFGDDAIGMNDAGNTQTVLGFLVGNGVAAGNCRAGFGNLVRAATENFGEQFQRQVVAPRGNVEREDHFAAHRVHIAHRVSGSDCAKRIRIIHDGRKEIDCLDDRGGLVDAINGGIVRLAQTNEERRKIFGLEFIAEWAQNLRQFGRADFGRSARARGVCS